MKKVVIKNYGNEHQLNFENVEENNKSLLPKHGEILIQTKSIGVNFADIVARMGLYETARKNIGLPLTPGFEFSGVVLNTGEGAEKFKIGQKVFGMSFFGAYSEKICIPEKQVFALPDFINMEDAGGLPVVFLTAYHSLYHHIVIKKNASILIHSAAGGVGSALIQLAKHILGPEGKVIGVVGNPSKIDYVKGLGADLVFERSNNKNSFWKNIEKHFPKGIDVILDANGTSTLKDSFNHLAPMGKLIAYGFHSMIPKNKGIFYWPILFSNYLRMPKFAPIQMAYQNKGVICFNLSSLFEQIDLFRESMDALVALIGENKLRIPKITKYSFQEVKNAHRNLESGETMGKLVLIP